MQRCSITALQRYSITAVQRYSGTRGLYWGEAFLMCSVYCHVKHIDCVVASPSPVDGDFTDGRVWPPIRLHQNTLCTFPP